METNATPTLQQRMKSQLEALGIPYKEIEVYGGQIVVTCWSEKPLARWISVISKFAKVRGTSRSVDYAKVNKHSAMRPTTIEVWRVFATMR